MKTKVYKGKELIKQCEKHGCRTVNGSGSHVKVYPPNREIPPMTIPNSGDLKPGILSKIIKWMLGAGIPLSIFIILINLML